VVTIVVLLALLLIALLVASTDVGRELFQGAPPTPEVLQEAPAVVPIAGARSFDPEVRDEENEDRAGRAVDGNPATTWPTDRYNSREFAGLKSGVGLILALDSVEALERIVVDSPSADWAASIYVSNGSPAALADWGPPVAEARAIPGALDLDLRGAQGDSVLIWITDLGTANKVEIAEVALAG